jgi:hypothetical protein
MTGIRIGLISIWILSASACGTGELRSDPSPRPTVIARGGAGEMKWEFFAYMDERGVACFGFEDPRARYNTCNDNVIGQPGNDTEYLDWSYLQVAGSGPTVFFGIAATEVKHVLVNLRDAEVREARLVHNELFPVQFFVLSVAGQAHADTFIAKDAQGRVLDRSP